MLTFHITATGVDLEYEGDLGANNKWVWDELTTNNEARISRIFLFKPADLLNPPSATQDFEDYEYWFRLGAFDNGYVRIPARILEIKNDLLISRDVTLKRSIFVAERNVSIFRRLSELLDHSDPIVIGGMHPDAIPRDVFEELLKKFPNTYELNRYADARVHTILSQYLDGMRDARGRYESYLNRNKSLTSTSKIDLDVLKKLEVEKYILIRDLIENSLETKRNWSEGDWQKLMLSFLLLLFPKYIMVLENVTIYDYYSNPSKKTDRFIDIALVDANGNLDIIEVKKPFDDKILRKSKYRDNSIPTSELSGSIMQAEKYLFHLSKWGSRGEDILTKKYVTELPQGMRIRISNPKAIIIVGRDQIGGANMTGSQLLDFEIIKRKYANMMDIITYDDLLRRLNNTIAALGG
ncbi:Shedu immune nuclease family protein [Pseudomonas chlororaphis]|uniref:Shedu immune nuclease family protein n=1 Tax=Pseudomonas chlororaphis TaxID=587753 RepID=UPI0018E9F004|nr:Shedu immune nuclease family protein [Pseudomonas chlororaphis]